MGIFTGFKSGFVKYIKQKLTTPLRKTLLFMGGIFILIGILFSLSQFKKESAQGRLLIWKVSMDGIFTNPIWVKVLTLSKQNMDIFKRSIFNSIRIMKQKQH